MTEIIVKERPDGWHVYDVLDDGSEKHIFGPYVTKAGAEIFAEGIRRGDELWEKEYPT